MQETLKEALIHEYEALIWGLIYKNFSYYSSKEDLFQAGYIGLDKALQNYQDNHNTKFSSYASFWILGEMRKVIREDRPVKISRDILSLSVKIEKVQILLTQKLGRQPNVSEIAEALGIQEWFVIEAFTSKKTIKSMEEPVNVEGKEICYHELVQSREKDLDLLLDLKDSLQKLSLEDKKLINDLYFKERTQSEIAKELHTSQVQVSRKKEKVLEKIRQDMTYC